MHPPPVALVAALAALSGIAGCLGGQEESGLGPEADGLPDLPVDRVTDAWYDADGPPTYVDHHAGFYSSAEPYHDLDDIAAKVEAWNATRPDLIDVRVIGQSWEGRPIWDVVVTDESVAGPKRTPLLDGGHHANELGGIEYTLYTVDFLLQNHDTNATVRHLLDTLEIHVVPVVNPDGYLRQTRGNALGVNLNRNYDIDWGNPLGASNPVMGTLAHATGQPMPSVTIVLENSGPRAFSEPETQAMRELMHELAPTAAFYLSGHTPTHAVIAPWAAYEPPFDVPAEHFAILEQELQWVRDHTEYEAGKAEWANFSAGLPYSASGSSMDYFYSVAEVPSFTVEVEWFATALTSETWPQHLLGDFEGLRYWMDATLPMVMHWLVNAERLAAWEPADPTTLVPEGSVPDPPERMGTPVPHL